MENFRVKPKLGPILKSVVLGVLIFAIAQFAAVQFILADELILMLWQEIICMLIYLGLFALSFFVIKAVPYFLTGRSHMRNVYVMGTTAVVFALGTFIRCVIQKKRRSLNKNFARLFIGTICALILLELSTRGAGMVFTANEPYYEAVEVTDYIKRAGGKPRITSYYIKVRFDDGTEKSFTVSKKTYHEAKKDTVKIKTFDSILGYKVQILEGEEPQFY